MNNINSSSSIKKGVSPIIGAILLVGLTVALITLASFILYDFTGDVNEISDSDVDIQDNGTIQLTNSGNADEVIVRTNESEYALETGELRDIEENEYSVIAIIDGDETLIAQYNNISSSQESLSPDSCEQDDNLEPILNNMSGSGDEYNPYRITNVCELQSMNEDRNSYYQLSNSINATETENWNDGEGFIPIGEPSDDKFTGELDGNNYKIENLYINRTNPEDSAWDNTVGLFSETDDSKVHNLYLSNVNITSQFRTGGLIGRSASTDVNSVEVEGQVESKSGTYTGGIIAYGINNGVEISDSRARDINVIGYNKTGGVIGGTSGLVTNTRAEGEIEGEYDVGGIVGYVDYTSINENMSDMRTEVNVRGYQNVGGITGYIDNEGGINNSVSHGTVFADLKYVGGILGYNEDGGNINDSFSTTTVEATEIKAGGLAGYVAVDISNSYATGNVTVTDGRGSSGGLIGASIGDIIVEDSHATGNVQTTSRHTGGLVGYLDSESQIINSYATGNVENENNKTGGLIGLVENDSIVENSYATGNVKNDGEHAGGLIGEVNDDSIIRKSYATGEVNSTQRSGGLIGHTWRDVTIENSYATGDVNIDEFTGGGLVGRLYPNSEVTNSYSQSDVIVNNGDGDYAAGLIAFAHDDTVIEESYSTGLVQGDGDYVGGYIGELRGTSTIGYWDIESSNQSEAIGDLGSDGSDDSTGLETDEMQGDEAAANMDEFDFEDTWNLIIDPDDYPELDYQE